MPGSTREKDASNAKINGHANGGVNGYANGSAKQSNGSAKKSLNGNAKEPVYRSKEPALGSPNTCFSKKFNTLFAFTLLGAVWVAVNSLKAGGGTQALCTQGDGRVYTVDEDNTSTECVVFRSAHIVDTGSVSAVTERWGGNRLQSAVSKFFSKPSLSVRFVPPGAIIVPGVTDSHAHILEYGASQVLPLEGTKSVQDTVQLVKEFILDNPDILNDKTKWVRGAGWDQTNWSPSSWPSAADLESDPITRGRRIVLSSKDFHAIWVSSEAMKLSGPFPESVEGGVIFRDENGDPSGVFLDNAQDLIKQPPPTEEDLIRSFKIAVEHAHANGLTSVHDAGLDPVSLAFFKRQAEHTVLPIRVYGMTFFNEHSPYWGNTTQPIVARDDYRLTARSVKIFADGALRTGGAALYEPYHDNPETSGFLRLGPEILFDIIPKYLRDGWQVNVHAIGDRANGIVLDAFEASLEGANVSALRPRLEHAQMMTMDDMKRLGKLGVIASVQPTHAISDMWYAEDRLGPERVKLLYAFRSILDSGARITLGSDFPVESMNPLSGFYAAVTRVSFNGKSPHGPDGWFPEQRLSRLEALRGMTIDPAYASFTETTLGSIEVGKRADFTVFSQDIMSIPAETILDTKVVATVIDGKTIFGTL